LKNAILGEKFEFSVRKRLSFQRKSSRSAARSSFAAL